jgi:hypothetical protein
MQCTQDLTTERVTKHKARLNLHGGKQEYGRNYYDTYAPVVTWFAIRLLIVFGILFHWALCKVDFVMAFPQAPMRWTCIRSFPRAFTPSTGISRIMSSSYLPTSMGKSKLVAYGTTTLSPSYERSTSSSLLSTIVSSTGMTSFSLSTSIMESSWDHQTCNCMVSSTSNRTSSCPSKIKVTLRIMLELISKSSRLHY